MDTPTPRLRLPGDVQSFKVMIRDGYRYVDKTDMVYRLTHDRTFNFLSRPRRFGKSLLVDTLDCYFSGRRELFDGLMIADLEQEWTPHAVVRLDLSGGGCSAHNFSSYLNNLFKNYEKQYGITPNDHDDLSVRFQNLLTVMADQTGRGVVVLIDEYDAPMQAAWTNPDEREAVKAIYRSVFAVLKMLYDRLRFVFLTGIARFSHLSLFSTFNNLCNLSFRPEYAGLCGITQDELDGVLRPYVQDFADDYPLSYDQMRTRLKENYDGYHFAWPRKGKTVDVYNPYSLLRALTIKEFPSEWTMSGSTATLNTFVKQPSEKLVRTRPTVLDRALLESSDLTGDNDEVLLYLTGYLTLVAADERNYYLDVPNKEVRTSLSMFIIPSLSTIRRQEIASVTTEIYNHLAAGRADEAMPALKGYINRFPFGNVSRNVMKVEERYALLVYVALAGMDLYMEREQHTQGGVLDLMMKAKSHVYVFEFKLLARGGATEAARQIVDNRYMHAYEGPGLDVTGLAVGLDNRGKGIVEYVVVRGDEPGPLVTLRKARKQTDTRHGQQ